MNVGDRIVASWCFLSGIGDPETRLREHCHSKHMREDGRTRSLISVAANWPPCVVNESKVRLVAWCRNLLEQKHDLVSRNFLQMLLTIYTLFVVPCCALITVFTLEVQLTALVSEKLSSGLETKWIGKSSSPSFVQATSNCPSPSRITVVCQWIVNYALHLCDRDTALTNATPPLRPTKPAPHRVVT